jgi:predicted ribosome quality control (RQC) complex YloA/Tae2 family protein
MHKNKPNMKSETVQFQNFNQLIEYHIGTNAQDNFDVIDSAQPEDLWFHVKGQPSCHVVAMISAYPPKTFSKKELHSIVKRGALLCKQNSRYKSDPSVEIDYTTIDNVQKTKIAGTVMLRKTPSVIAI